MPLDQQPPPYVGALEGALERARALGRADGDLAAGFEWTGFEPAEIGPWCHGRHPDDLASLVWAGGRGTAPAGVRLNAPLWYAQGFREAVAAARTRRAVRLTRPPAGAAPLRWPGPPEPF